MARPQNGVINTRLTVTLKRQAAKRAADLGLTLTEYIRYLIVNDIQADATKGAQPEGEEIK